MTVRKQVSGFVRSHLPGDRRMYPRFDILELHAKVGGRVYPVADFSISGIRIAGLHLDGPAPIHLRILSSQGTESIRGIDVRGEVVHSDQDGCRIRFLSLNYSLARLLINALAQRTGVKPYLFR